ncbi:uncharacterized protein LOC130986646 isoform X2 [Salvia miltiorrhiza]|uniref:uncharacterized protein LOC130986646 isoform X2 n=1 Tax=Salvia miltiorrhiza TaxID=226208 RepID=UPI0025AB9CAB|nr:uncharacterized protein LOC130986646 isoform X2 [Salvia miltiorrhiza]
MEQSATSSSSLLASATEDEINVSRILLDLRNLMSLSESLSNCNWGRRRRRSCLEPPPPPLTAVPSLPENRIEERRTPIKGEDEKHGGGARTTASPDTPLSFSPSESDDKPKHSSKKTSKKRSREDYLDMIEGLTQRKELLSGEIENVKKYYNKLKAYNSQLKAMKQEAFNSGLRRENSEMGLIQHYRMLQPDPTAQCGSGPIAAHLQPSDYGLGSANNGGPLEIDLNLPAEEAFGGVELYRPSDAAANRRARYAEARRKRIGIIKTKSNRSAL